MSHIETGSTKLSLSVFAAIAFTLGIRTDDLLYDFQYPTKNAAANEIYDILEHCSLKTANKLAAIIRAIKPIINDES